MADPTGGSSPTSVDAIVVEERSKTKNLRFFSEYILVTVVSLIVAMLWIEWMKRVWASWVGDSLVVQMVLVLVITAIAVILLSLISNKPVVSKKIPSEKDVQLKMHTETIRAHERTIAQLSAQRVV